MFRKFLGEYQFSSFKAILLKEETKMFSCELSEILGTPILKTAVSVYCEAIINLEKSLLVHDLLLIDLTELY